jgi:hypothetical protein
MLVRDHLEGINHDGAPAVGRVEMSIMAKTVVAKAQSFSATARNPHLI